MTKQKPKEKPMPTSPYYLWTISELAEATGMSARILYGMIRSGKLHAKRTGTGNGSFRVPHSEVLKLTAGTQ